MAFSVITEKQPRRAATLRGIPFSAYRPIKRRMIATISVPAESTTIHLKYVFLSSVITSDHRKGLRQVKAKRATLNN